MGKLRKENLARFRAQMSEDQELHEALRSYVAKGYARTMDAIIPTLQGETNAADSAGVVVALQMVIDMIYDQARKNGVEDFPAMVDFFKEAAR